jgi:outer membrane protein assembly factor BamB
MKTTSFIFICVVILFSATTAHAQWQVQLSKTVNWYQVNPTGNLIVGTSDGIVGMDDQTGALTYTVQAIPSPSEDEFRMIPNTPFGMISRGQGKLETKVIFNVTNGMVLFDSKKENILVGKQYILPNSGDILMQGLKGISSVFFLVDAASGKVKWELIDFFGKSIFAEVIDGNPITIDNERFIFPTTGGRSGGGVYCFSMKDGAQIWRAALPTLKGAVTTTVNEAKVVTSYLLKDQCFYIKGQAVMSYDLLTGKERWAEPAKQKGLPDLVIYDPVGLIVASATDPKNNLTKPTMVMYDYKTGGELWLEPLKLKGTVRQYSYCEKGLIISMDAGNGKSQLNIVDLEKGTYIFSDTYKVNGTVLEMKLIGNAVYVRTDREEDIVSIESNASILPQSIASSADKPLVNRRVNEFSYTFNPTDGILYMTNLKSSTQSPVVAEKIVFEQKETPASIEIIKDMIVLSSSQTIAAYSKDGKEVFKTHIPAPGISGWKKALLATSAILNSMDAMRYADLEAKAKEAGKNIRSPEGREFCDAIAQLANRGTTAHLTAASKEMDMIKKRYKSSAAGSFIQFILAKLDTKEYALVGVSKISGQKIKEINIGKDKEPKYVLDDLSGKLYYLSTSNEMKAIMY